MLVSIKYLGSSLWQQGQGDSDSFVGRGDFLTPASLQTFA